MRRRRKIAVPFVIGSGKVATLQDLKSVLSESPEELIIPLRDGRLERFLSGISPRYLEYIDENNPEDSIKKLAEILGVEVKGEIRIDGVSVVTSVEELLKLLEEGKGEINIAKGTFVIDKLVLRKPVRLRGQGKNDTYLKVNELIIDSSEEIVFENLACEVETLTSFGIRMPKVIDTFFSSTKSKIEVKEPIEINGENISYENVDFIFKGSGSITFCDCKGTIDNCSFLFNEREGEDFAFVIGNFEIRMSNCNFKGGSIATIIVSSEVKIREAQFESSGVIVHSNSVVKVESSNFKDCFGIGCFTSSIEIINCSFLQNRDGISIVESQGIVKSSNFEECDEFHIRVKGISSLRVSECRFSKSGVGIITADLEEGEIPITSGNTILKSGSTLLEVSECRFLENGFGIALMKEGSILKISDCEFLKNAGGVGLYSSRLEAQKCKFVESKNQGILLINKSQGTIRDSAFKGNEVGIKSDSSELEAQNCEFAESKPCGIWLTDKSQGTIKDSAFKGNELGIQSDNSELEIQNCEFIESKSCGVGLADESKGTIRDSTFKGNKVGIWSDSSKLEAQNCEFVENEPRGIWLTNKSQGTIRDSAFKGNEVGIKSDSSKLEAQNCEFVENKPCGIWLTDKSQGTIRDSKFLENGLGAILEGALHKIETSIFKENESWGIIVKSNRVKIINCEVDSMGYMENCNEPEVINSTIDSCFVLDQELLEEE